MLFKPDLFFQNLPKTLWSEDSLTFSMITGWILAFSITIVVFINSYFPTGLNLISGIYGNKLIIALPVLLVMGLAFFLMTLFIVAGLIIIALLSMFFAGGAAFNFILILLGGSGNIFDTIKASLFSSGAMLIGAINIILMIAVKYKLMSFSIWILLEKIVFYSGCILLFILFTVFGIHTHKVPKWKAMLAATVPFIVLILFNIVLSSKVLPKLSGFLD
jgi:hypothetical protein